MEGDAAVAWIRAGARITPPLLRVALEHLALGDDVWTSPFEVVFGAVRA